MRLEQLEYLMEIHKTHSINIASQNLHVSQQNISKSIRKLEAELGMTLLMRSVQGTYLTTEGLSALKHIQTIFHELSVMKTAMALSQEQEPSLSGNLRIMYVSACNIDCIYTSIRSFSAQFPNVKISFHQKSLAKLLSAIHNQEIDIGFIASADDFQLKNAIDHEKLKSLAIYPLTKDTLVAAVSHTSPFASQKSISINKLLKNQLLFLQQESDDVDKANWLFHLLCHYGTPQFHLTTNAFELYVKAIADNAGIGFFTQSSKKCFSSITNENIVLLPIRPTITLFQGYVLNNAQPISNVTAAYLPYLLKQVKL